jgi:hypothetical protein
VPFRTVPFRDVRSRAVSYRRVPYRFVPFRAVPFRAVPFRVVSSRAVTFLSYKELSMSIRPYTLTLVSDTELLMDRDNITFGEDLKRWQKDPVNADKQSPGDDRVPAWGWLGKLHYSETNGLIGVPQGMLAACVRAAATMIPHPTAKGSKSLKEVSQSGLLFTETSFPLFVRGQMQDAWHAIAFPDLYQRLATEEQFAVHEQVAREAGLRLDVRRSKPQYNRSHIRVRPMFGPWRCVCHMQIVDDILTQNLVRQIFQTAGMYKGIGNWRPSVGRAGSYGMFSVVEGVLPELQEQRVAGQDPPRQGQAA